MDSPKSSSILQALPLSGEAPERFLTDTEEPHRNPALIQANEELLLEKSPSTRKSCLQEK
jgi:hypothetical protein